MSKQTARTLKSHQLGLQDYLQTWRAMQACVVEDEMHSQLWFTEHPPVFTQGQAGKAEHLLSPGDIPVVQSDRGGQVTYHGPGQAIIYLMIDLKEAGIGIRSLVNSIEEAVIRTLDDVGIYGVRRKGAPGIYVDDAKVASIGLRVKKFRSYHGVSINTDMDLEPFTRINPCGYEELSVTDLTSLGVKISTDAVQQAFAQHLAAILGYTISE